MVWEWFLREGGIVFNWWLLVTVAGFTVLPLCMRLLGGLPDRGYTLSRTVGLLLIGFTFWLLASVGFLNNSVGSILLSWLIVFVISLVIYVRGEQVNLRAWWRENNRVIIVTELVFIVLFLSWALVRAQHPQYHSH